MVFMMEKALICIIFMYAVSFSLFGAQFLIGDVLGLTITNQFNQPVKSSLLTITNSNQFNAITINGTTVQRPISATDGLTKAVQAGVELFQLLTGSYIFNILTFFGIPTVIIYPFSGLYGILAIRALIGYLKEFI